MNGKTLREAAEWLCMFGHPSRLRMVETLLDGKYTLGELADPCLQKPRECIEYRFGKKGIRSL